jgi:hypothetical protein
MGHIWLQRESVVPHTEKLAKSSHHHIQDMPKHTTTFDFGHVFSAVQSGRTVVGEQALPIHTHSPRILCQTSCLITTFLLSSPLL